MRTHAPSSGLAYIHPHVAMSKDTSNLVSGPDVASALFMWAPGNSSIVRTHTLSSPTLACACK